MTSLGSFEKRPLIQLLTKRKVEEFFVNFVTLKYSNILLEF